MQMPYIPVTQNRNDLVNHNNSLNIWTRWSSSADPDQTAQEHYTIHHFITKVNRTHVVININGEIQTFFRIIYLTGIFHKATYNKVWMVHCI